MMRQAVEAAATRAARPPQGKVIHRWPTLLLSSLALLLALSPALAYAQAAPERAISRLPVSNGFGVGVYDIDQAKLTTFREHVYKVADPDLPPTRNVAFDAYFGVRSSHGSQWLNSLPVDDAEYLGGDGILRVSQHQGPSAGGIVLETYVVSSFSLDMPSLFLVLHAKNTGTFPQSDVSLFALLNFHVGKEGEETQGEEITFDGTQYIERGVFANRALVYRPFPAASVNACSPQNPFGAVVAGQHLVETATSGLANDAVAGFEWILPGGLAGGEEAWVAVAIGGSTSGDAQAVVSALNSYLSGLSGADEILTREQEEWAAWRATEILPEGMSPEEAKVARLSTAILRMGQSREHGPARACSRAPDRAGGCESGPDRKAARRGVPGGTARSGNAADGPEAPAPATEWGSRTGPKGPTPFGQIIASIHPGQWDIAWVRDGALAIVALAESGHLSEARAGLAFMLRADAGFFSDFVGADYQISVTRYFGLGIEESDFNQDGPNIEFDDFGLFLLALGRYVEASGDLELVTQHKSEIFDKTADVLVGLIDPETGLLLPDSSIWESHFFNGGARRYGFSAIMAVLGLREAATLAEALGDERAETYQETADAIALALRANLVDNAGLLAGSFEELEAGRESGLGYYDGAVLSAFVFGALPADDALAQSTVLGLREYLACANGRGVHRNDNGDSYDEAEWALVDLWLATSLRRIGEEEAAEALLGWITAQAIENFGIVPELFDPVSGLPTGEAPMVGFGAGAYLLSLFDRARDNAPTDPKDPDPKEPKEPTDPEDVVDFLGGGCAVAPGGEGAIPLVFFVLGLGLLWWRRSGRQGRRV